MVPIKQILSGVAKWSSKNSNTLLTVFTSVGVVVTGVTAYKAGYDTGYDISLREGEGEDLTKKDKAKMIAKSAVVPVLTGGLTMAGAIDNNISHVKKERQMARSYALLAESAESFRRNVRENLGEHKFDKVLGEQAKKEFAEVTEEDFQAINTDGGGYLFKDGVTKQYFRSSADYVRKMQNKVNSFYAQGENFVTVGEWCSFLGIEPPCDSVSSLGWPSCGVQFDLASTICPNGEPGYYICYDIEPMTEDEGEVYDNNHFLERSYM